MQEDTRSCSAILLQQLPDPKKKVSKIRACFSLTLGCWMVHIWASVSNSGNLEVKCSAFLLHLHFWFFEASQTFALSLNSCISWALFEGMRSARRLLRLSLQWTISQGILSIATPHHGTPQHCNTTPFNTITSYNNTPSNTTPCTSTPSNSTGSIHSKTYLTSPILNF